jgi:hypothetical protein
MYEVRTSLYLETKEKTEEEEDHPKISIFSTNVMRIILMDLIITGVQRAG